MDYNKLTKDILGIGNSMYESGAEVNRVEDSLIRMLKSYNCEYVEVFVITNQITISTKFGDEAITLMRRTNPVRIDFYRLDRLNNLSRQICSKQITEEEIEAEHSKIMAPSKKKQIFPYIGSFICALGFTLLFGGDFLDAVVAGSLGLIVATLNQFVKPKINQFIYAFVVSFIISILGILLSKIGIGHNIDKVLIGTVMLMIPGMVITNSARDIFLGDTITGSLRIIESLILVVCISAGYGLGIYLLARGTVQSPSVDVPWWLSIISGLFAAYGIAFIFNPTRRVLIFSGVGALLALIVYQIIKIYIDNPLLLTFIVSLIACSCSEIMSRFAKTPAIALITVSMMPFYPGSAFYYTFSYLVNEDYSLFQENFRETAYKLTGLVCGLVLVTVAFKYIHRLITYTMNQRKQKN